MGLAQNPQKRRAASQKKLGKTTVDPWAGEAIEPQCLQDGIIFPL
jgi:hypothetical protein